MKFFFDNIEDNGGKKENTGHQHFLLFPQSFQTYQRNKSSFLLILFGHLEKFWIRAGLELATGIFFFSHLFSILQISNLKSHNRILLFANALSFV